MSETVRPLVELSDKDGDLAWSRWVVIAPTVDEDVPLTRAAAHAGVPISTARRWLSATAKTGSLVWRGHPGQIADSAAHN